MKKICVSVMVLSVALFASTSTSADSLGSPPESGLGLGCTICPLPGPPNPQEPQQPIQVSPARPAVEGWYFVSYGHNAGTRGPFSTETDCEIARQLVDSADRCFKERRIKNID